MSAYFEELMFTNHGHDKSCNHNYSVMWLASNKLVVFGKGCFMEFTINGSIYTGFWEYTCNLAITPRQFIAYPDILNREVIVRSDNFEEEVESIFEYSTGNYGGIYA